VSDDAAAPAAFSGGPRNWAFLHPADTALGPVWDPPVDQAQRPEKEKSPP
jgi:hypothetical protein